MPRLTVTKHRNPYPNMHYTIYTQESPGCRIYQGSARGLAAAMRACEFLAGHHRSPLVMVPRNPRLPTIRYRIAQKPLPNATQSVAMQQ